jgi:hypothetical protein
MPSTTTLPHEASATFAQAAVAALERVALYLFRHLSFENGEQLSCALQRVRRELRLAPPLNPLLDCRDWPLDDEAGRALGMLLERLDALERAHR